jgi:agmatine deiminase
MARRMPAETDPHECTLMAWPTRTREAALWGDHLEAARDDHAEIAMSISRYEPVLLIANPEDANDAAERFAAAPAVEVVPLAIDDSWMRDSGPVFVRTGTGERRGVHFQFNAWGNKFTPYDADATIGARVCEYLGIPSDEAPLVLEGGSVSVDGGGIVVTTERCLLNKNRNPELSREQIETALGDYLGANEIVWLADGIVEDDGTDGHVDNVVAFFAPGAALLQGCDDEVNPNHASAADNRARLEAAGIDVVEVPYLPYATVDGKSLPVPYVNFYVTNRAVFVPTTGDDRDDEALQIIGNQFPRRVIVGVPGAILAHGGGGVHCITQQVPTA